MASAQGRHRLDLLGLGRPGGRQAANQQEGRRHRHAQLRAEQVDRATHPIHPRAGARARSTRPR